MERNLEYNRREAAPRNLKHLDVKIETRGEKMKRLWIASHITYKHPKATKRQTMLKRSIHMLFL